MHTHKHTYKIFGESRFLYFEQSDAGTEQRAEKPQAESTSEKSPDQRRQELLEQKAKVPPLP